MATNTIQKIIILDIAANTQTLIEAKLAIGYVITHIVNLQPLLNKVLIIYTTPPDIT